LKAVTEYLLGHGYGEIIAGAFDSNLASIRVMQKCGMNQMERTEAVDYQGRVQHCVFYSIKK